MSVVKFAAGRDTWVLDVEEVTVVRCFRSKDFGHPSDAAFKDGKLMIDGPPSVHLVEYDTGEPWDGVVLSIKKRGKEYPECWVAPQGQIFLMSDEGKTIDRI